MSFLLIELYNYAPIRAGNTSVKILSTVVDNSALTGESKLIKVKENSKVLSGGINVQGI